MIAWPDGSHTNNTFLIQEESSLAKLSAQLDSFYLLKLMSHSREYMVSFDGDNSLYKYFLSSLIQCFPNVY